MPGMSGSDFVRELRSLIPHMPVLVITGLAEAEEEYAGMNVEFRVKPLAPEGLLTTVHRMLTKSTTQSPLATGTNGF